MQCLGGSKGYHFSSLDPTMPPDEKKTRTNTCTGSAMYFPGKLWNAATSDKCNLIQWTKDGRSIVFIDPLTRLFKVTAFPHFGDSGSTWQSMQRQLNYYQFRKLNAETLHNSRQIVYRNDNFTRMNLATSLNIQRKVGKRKDLEVKRKKKLGISDQILSMRLNALESEVKELRKQLVSQQKMIAKLSTRSK